ncbi:MAG TPA: crosslink repair DNA glycosylase YcaQ family protein [Candidatus Limnocylindrales bacterium]|nr:crosslink repair DNA glycosylase YcaQ family protein [Candidatus Limnocylindrales bacterium]
MAKQADRPKTQVTWAQVLAFRLSRQHVVERTNRRRLVDVVGEMIGLHAQVMSSAELQAAARIDGLRRTDVQDALWRRRALVKVWAFRQTLHLLTPGDLAEFVIAARSLERWHTPAWLRYFKLSEADVEEILEALGAVLGDQPMTRVEVVEAVLGRVRKPALRDDMLTGWGTFLAPAAQRGHLVFGPSEGRNVAFVQPSSWLGRPIRSALGRPAAADEALGRLIVRYLAAFPGASRDMIARWWGGGRMAAVSRALRTIDEPLAEVDVEGTRALVLGSDEARLATTEPNHPARLLPGFDPFTNELPRRVEAVLSTKNHERVHRTAGWVTPVVVADGRIVGTWEIGDAKSRTVAVRPFERLPKSITTEVRLEVERIAEFLDRPLKPEISKRL